MLASRAYGTQRGCAGCCSVAHLCCADIKTLDPAPPHRSVLTEPHATRARRRFQDNIRPTGNDTAAKQEKWLRRVVADRCARPEVTCRDVYSMGVRQAVWRQKLYLEPDMRIVSAGIPDYLTAVPQATN